MKIKRIVVFLIIVMIVCVVLAFLFRSVHSSESLTLVLQTDAYTKSLYPNSQVYVLYHQEQDVGIIKLRDGKIGEIMITDKATRHISIHAKDDVFPGKLSVSLCQGNAARPTEMVYDDNLDGIPDKRVELAYAEGSLGKSSLYELEEIKWKPIKRARSQPAATQKVDRE